AALCARLRALPRLLAADRTGLRPSASRSRSAGARGGDPDDDHAARASRVHRGVDLPRDDAAASHRPAAARNALRAGGDCADRVRRRASAQRAAVLAGVARALRESVLPRPRCAARTRLLGRLSHLRIDLAVILIHWISVVLWILL